MCELMEMRRGDDPPFLQQEMMCDLTDIMYSSSFDDVQFSGNDKMRELMERQFSSSVDDEQLCGKTVHIMYYELYQAVCDEYACSDRFIYVLEQVCTKKKVDLSTIFNQVTPTGDSFLHVAAQHGSEQVLCLIAFHYPQLLYKTNLKGDTPLHVAARNKNLLAVKNILRFMDKHFMIHKEEFIMLRNNYGRSALHEAVLCMDYYMVLLLLFVHNQSDLTTYWTWNYHYDCKSPMYLAVLTRDRDVLFLLLKRIPILLRNISNGDSPLHAAISERNEDLLKIIVDTTEELLHQRDENDNTPLHYAAYAGYMEGVCIILEKSPMIAFQRNSDGDLPIHHACRKGHVQVVKKLLEIEWSSAGFFLNDKGQTILHIAAIKGRTDLIKYLLKHPKVHYDTINERDVNGDTPLHLAARELRLWTLLLLSRDKVIDMNLVNNKGFTARDVVWMQCKIPMTRQEFLTDAILESVGVPLKGIYTLGIRQTTSTNKDWNVKDAASTLIVVAILIATVTFTAGFTIPRGFYSSDGQMAKERGLALFTDRRLFKIFMAFNTIAMYSSTIGSVILLWVPLGDLRFAEGVYGLAKIFVYVALIAMPVAYLAAIRLIVSNNTLLADVVSIIGSIFIFFIIFVRILGLFPLRSRRPLFRQLASLLIRIIIILFYGWNDIDQVGEVSQVESRNQNIERVAPDIHSEERVAPDIHFEFPPNTLSDPFRRIRF